MPLFELTVTDRALDYVDSLAPKIKRQILKKVIALQGSPFPPTCKKLHDVETADGEPVYRERSGDYRILYVVRQRREKEVVIIDIDNRKAVYRRPNTSTGPANLTRDGQGSLEGVTRHNSNTHKVDGKLTPQPSKRLSAFPRKNRD